MGSSGAVGTAGNFTVGGQLQLTSGATIKLGASGDTDLYRLGVNRLGTDGALYLGSSSAPGTIGGFGGIYVESGALKYVGASGTITTLAPT